MFFFINNMQNQVSFTSNIKFVDPYHFLKIRKGDRIGYKHNEINILKSPRFYSEEIRTCTGGGLVNPQLEAEGFHFWDDLKNKKNFNIIINSLFRFIKNPQQALLIGSKDLNSNPLSIEQFQKIKQIFQERIPNITIFEKHQFRNSESHYHYSLKDDTWTICSTFNTPDDISRHSIKTIDDLKTCFEHIQISPQDKLYISNKEITPKDYPDIFKINDGN